MHVSVMPDSVSPLCAAPKAANPAVFNISVDACGSVPAAMFFENGATPSQRMHHLARQISAAGEALPRTQNMPSCGCMLWGLPDYAGDYARLHSGQQAERLRQLA